MTTHIAEVITFISRHDVGFGKESVLRIDGDKLVVRGTATNVDNEPFSTIDTIPATMRAARDWLGY